MEHGQSFVLRHIHLVQHAKAAQAGAGADRAFPEHHLAVLQGVRADEGGRVHVDVHGHVPAGATEHGGQVLRQHVLAGGLRAGQQQVLAAQQRGGGALPYLLAIVKVVRRGDAGLGLRRRGVLGTEGLYLLQQGGVNALVPQLFPNIRHDASLLLGRFFCIIILRSVKRMLSIRKQHRPRVGNAAGVVFAHLATGASSQ